MENNDIVTTEMFEEEPYKTYIQILKERVQEEKSKKLNITDSILKLIYSRGEIREDNFKWLTEHFFDSEEIKKSFMAFLLESPSVIWLDFLWESLIESQMDNRKAFYYIKEMFSAYLNGFTLDEVKECFEQGSNPTEFTILVRKKQKYKVQNNNELNDKVNNLNVLMEQTIKSIQEKNDELLQDKIIFYKNRCENLQQELQMMHQNRVEEQMDSKNEVEDKIEEKLSFLVNQMESIKRTLELMGKSIITELEKKESNFEPKFNEMDSSAIKEDDFNIQGRGKIPIISDIFSKRDEKKFNQMNDFEQKEAIFQKVLSMKDKDSHYMKLMKELINSDKVGNSFIYTFIRNKPKESDLEKLLYIIHSNSQTEETSILEKQKEPVLVTEIQEDDDESDEFY